MFEANLKDMLVFKKIVESVKDLVKEANFELAPDGISMQAMDTAHVALVSCKLFKAGFDNYITPKPITLGTCILSLF